MTDCSALDLAALEKDYEEVGIDGEDEVEEVRNLTKVERELKVATGRVLVRLLALINDFYGYGLARSETNDAPLRVFVDESSCAGIDARR